MSSTTSPEQLSAIDGRSGLTETEFVNEYRNPGQPIISTGFIEGSVLKSIGATLSAYTLVVGPQPFQFPSRWQGA